MIVLLLFLYPLISANALVGTDLTQAVPLTAAAALGALIFGTVEFGVTASIIIGAVPAVLIGSFFSSRAPDRYIRPIITFVIFASGLKYIGVATTALGWILCAVLLTARLLLAVPHPAVAQRQRPGRGRHRERSGQRERLRGRAGQQRPARQRPSRQRPARRRRPGGQPAPATSG